MQTNYEEAIRILSAQEKELQFDSFDTEDAWKLGNIMVEEIKSRGIELAASIRKLNGHIVFQYGSAGSNLNHQRWMGRKFNTVCYMECSSLLADARAHFLGRSMDDFGLNYAEYKFCGGGFPIRIKGSGMTMVITVSGLAHEKDHAFIVECLEKYLGKSVPALDMEIPML